MIYVFEGGSVVYDGSTISEEQKARAVVVEALPEPQTPEGKYPVLRANKATETVYYEYKDIPPQPEIEELKTRLRESEQAILELSQLLGGVQ
jgi:hypothetical protein